MRRLGAGLDWGNSSKRSRISRSKPHTSHHTTSHHHKPCLKRKISARSKSVERALSEEETAFEELERKGDARAEAEAELVRRKIQKKLGRRAIEKLLF